MSDPCELRVTEESDAGSEMEGSVTAANQITVSLGCLMSALLCDSLLTAPSTMKECKTRFSTVSHTKLHD